MYFVHTKSLPDRLQQQFMQYPKSYIVIHNFPEPLKGVAEQVIILTGNYKEILSIHLKSEEEYKVDKRSNQMSIQLSTRAGASKVLKVKQNTRNQV